MTPNTPVQKEEVTSVTFMSYNPTGLNSTAKCRFSNIVCNDYQVDFLSVQEHFKFNSNTNQYFKKQFPDYFSYVTDHLAKTQSELRQALPNLLEKKWK